MDMPLPNQDYHKITPMNRIPAVHPIFYFFYYNSIGIRNATQNPSPILLHTLLWAHQMMRTLPKEGSALQTDKPNTNACSTGCGSLPGDCGAMVFPYIAFQENDPPRYGRTEALQTGTLFPGLNLPFKAAIASTKNIANTALAELMALDFAVDELALYLTTHSDDKEVLELYWNYVRLAEEGRKKYHQLHGPLQITDRPNDGSFSWLDDPWPWDRGGNR